MTSPFSKAAAAFIASRGSKGTRVVYAANLALWVAIYCKKHKIDPAKPTLADATAFRDDLVERHKPATARNVIASLSGIYGTISEGERPAATWNPFSPKVLAWPKATDFSKTESVPAGIAARMIAAAEADETPSGRRDAAILHLLHSTGLRRMSIAGMRRADLRDRGDALAVAVKVKGGDEVEVTIPDEAAAALKRWIAVAPESEYVFPGRKI